MNPVHVDPDATRPGSLLGDTAMVAAMLGVSGRHVRRLAARGVFRTVGKTATGKQGRPALVFDLRQVADAWSQIKHRKASA